MHALPTVGECVVSRITGLSVIEGEVQMRYRFMKLRMAPAGAALLLGLGLFAFAGSQNASAATTYTAGHADIGVAYEEPGDLWLHYHFGSNAQPPSIASSEVEPAEIVTQVIDDPVPRPAGTQWNFLGTPAGEPLWYLPQGEDPAKPFLGLATEELESSDWVGSLQWILKSVVSSPADSNFSLWQTNFFGSPVVLWDTADGLGVDDQFSLPTGTHSHYNWGFTKQGVYKLEFEVRGTHVADGLQIATDVFTFNVVPEPGTWVMAAMALSGLACVTLRRRITRR